MSASRLGGYTSIFPASPALPKSVKPAAPRQHRAHRFAHWQRGRCNKVSQLAASGSLRKRQTSLYVTIQTRRLTYCSIP